MLERGFLESVSNIRGETHRLAKNFRSAFVDKYIDRYQQLAQASPAGRIGEASEVAATIAFLASEEAPFITGESINISGGLYLRP